MLLLGKFVPLKLLLWTGVSHRLRFRALSPAMFFAALPFRVPGHDTYSRVNMATEERLLILRAAVADDDDEEEEEEKIFHILIQ